MCHRACSLVGRVVIRSPTAGEVVNFRSIETEVCRLLATITRSGTLESPRDFAADFDEDRASATALLRAVLVLSQQYG